MLNANHSNKLIRMLAYFTLSVALSLVDGTSFGSQRGRTFRSSHSGNAGTLSSRYIASSLAAAIIGYQGARIHRNISPNSSFMFYPSNGRTYYYGERYYPNDKTSTALTCNYTIGDDDEFFNLTYADGGSKVTEILYECNTSSEECCDGLECCRKNISIWIIILIVCGCLVILCMLLPCFKRCARRKIKTEHGTPPADHPSVPQSDPTSFANYQHSTMFRPAPEPRQFWIAQMPFKP